MTTRKLLLLAAVIAITTMLVPSVLAANKSPAGKSEEHSATKKWPKPLVETPSVHAPVQQKHVLVLGRISDDPRAHYEQLKPLLDYVVSRMADVGIREGRILMARDTEQMARYLHSGHVDWVTETTGAGLLLRKSGGARPILLTERDGVRNYYTMFVTRRDAGLRDLDALPGRSIAFQSSLSTSAYFVPAAHLLGHGLPLSILLSPRDRPAPGVVGYVFARSERNVATWVHKRLVDVGVMSNLNWNNPDLMPPEIRRDLMVLHKTPEYPRALELVRSDLDLRIRKRLAEVLKQAANDPEAREPMLQFFRTTRFLAIDGESMRALDRIAEGVDRVRAEVE